MRYPFFLKWLTRLPDELVDHLTSEVAALDFETNTMLWDHRRHLGITGIRYPQGQVGLMADVLPLLEPFGLGTFFNYEIDCLMAGGQIAWHTDVTTLGAKCQQQHRLHIPLTGDGLYWFCSGGKNAALRMTRGCVYVFNNLVHHSVQNLGTESRTNIMLNYDAQV